MRLGPARALALRTLADARVRTLSFALLFAGVALANTAGYRNTYPTLADRLRFAQSFGANKAARLFYGTPHRLDTVGGYASWRVAGLLSLFAAFFGAFSPPCGRSAARRRRGGTSSSSQARSRERAAFTSRLVAIGAMIARAVARGARGSRRGPAFPCRAPPTWRCRSCR